MDTQSTFTVSFYVRNDKKDKQGEVPVYMRVTVNGRRVEISTNRKINLSNWSSSGKAKGYKSEIKEFNNYLDLLRSKIYDIRSQIIQRDEIVTAQKIKNEFLGLGKRSKTVNEVFDYHNQRIKELVDQEYSNSTYKRYVTTQKHVNDFLIYRYNIKDIHLNELTHEFITEFEYYLKTVRKCNHNSTAKYIKNFKKIINIAFKNEWLDKDPFANYSIKIKEVNRGYLEQYELNEIENKEIGIERLEIIRDAFVFSCYTGLAYVDLASLTPESITTGIDGSIWIKIFRTKTDIASNVPLLPKAIEIIKKYKNHPLAISRNQVIPVPSNQKVNAYLKELASICGIDKNLTFHLARHTFATTVTLANGVSIESVSHMLGHKNIRTTQIYAKVSEQKVSNDMLKLKEKFSSHDKAKRKNKS